MPILRQNIIFFIKLTKVLEVTNFRFLANFRFLTLDLAGDLDHHLDTGILRICYHCEIGPFSVYVCIPKELTIRLLGKNERHSHNNVYSINKFDLDPNKILNIVFQSWKK